MNLLILSDPVKMSTNIFLILMDSFITNRIRILFTVIQKSAKLQPLKNSFWNIFYNSSSCNKNRKKVFYLFCFLLSTFGSVSFVLAATCVGISVTRWPDYVFNIWPFTAMKISPKSYKLCQSELKTLPKNE